MQYFALPHLPSYTVSTTDSGKTITFPAYATVKATYDAKYGSGAWDAIVASKPNWTIAYN